MTSKEEPYSKMSAPQIIIGVTQRGLRPEVPKNCPPKLAELMKKCWETDPNKRPTMKEIISELKPFTTTTNFSISEVNAEISTAEDMKLTLVEANVNKIISEQQNPANQPAGGQREVQFSDILFQSKLASNELFDTFLCSVFNFPVIVKVVKDNCVFEEFLNEIVILKNIQSPCLLQIYGSFSSPQKAIISEYFPAGSVFDLISKPVSCFFSFSFPFPKLISFFLSFLLLLSSSPPLAGCFKFGICGSIDA